MITPEEFPYIKNLHVNYCYTYMDFGIKLHNYKPFSHLILTGKNGSGKTTILNAINMNLAVLLRLNPDLEGNSDSVIPIYRDYDDAKSDYRQGMSSGWKNLKEMEEKIKNYNQSTNIRLYNELDRSDDYGIKFYKLSKGYVPFSKYMIFSLFEARRNTDPKIVEVPTKQSLFSEILTKLDSGKFLHENFQQYLVNKRVNQAFDIIDNRNENIKDTDRFFEELTDKFRIIFDDMNLKINFIRENFEIQVELSDKRKITFKELPDGLSALLRILLELFIRVDLVRKQVRNKSYNPCGIVLIDEPEVHLHLELQEQVLPLLTELFPNVQFIVATHSPAVIASIKNATIFDLTTKETRVSEETVGRSYAELTTSHFGLKNNYSAIADEIVRQINEAVNVHQYNPDVLKQALEKIAREQGDYLSPTLRVEMELLIAKAEAKQAVAK